jgi:hypothetical protein
MAFSFLALADPYLLAVHSHVIGCFDAQPHAVAADVHDDDLDAVADDDGFLQSP